MHEIEVVGNIFFVILQYFFSFSLAKAFADLKGILESEQDLKENEDYIAAEQVLKEAEVQLPESS